MSVDVPSIELSKDKTSRRTLLKVILGGSAAASLSAFLYPILRYIVPPAETNMGADSAVAANVDELKPNSSKIFRFGSRPALLIRMADGNYRAISATCTHLGCTVQYRTDLQQVWCACHNGMYDTNGRNISGPPPRPLEKYQVHVQGNEIQVTKA